MAEKPIWALGAMSGTSLDGVDAAMVLCDGAHILEFGESAYRPYSEAERRVLRRALGAWQGQPPVAEAEAIIELAHTELLSQFAGAEIVGFHGQTLAHDPATGRTHQAGNGQRLAEALDLPVVWDFRSADVEMGGQGAPLAPVFHHAAAMWAGIEGPVVFLNIGGVANLTLVVPEMPVDQPGALTAFDTGPGNAQIDDLMTSRTGRRFDKDGAMAAAGRADTDVISRALKNPYFARLPPKSLDRMDFAHMLERVADLETADAAATLTILTAEAAVEGIEQLATQPLQVFLTGGGRNNPVIRDYIAGETGIPVARVEEIGLNGDMFEAQAFGFLAARVRYGHATTFPGTTGVAIPLGGGLVSRPSA